MSPDINDFTHSNEAENKEVSSSPNSSTESNTHLTMQNPDDSSIGLNEAYTDAHDNSDVTLHNQDISSPILYNQSEDSDNNNIDHPDQMYGVNSSHISHIDAQSSGTVTNEQSDSSNLPSMNDGLINNQPRSVVDQLSCYSTDNAAGGFQSGPQQQQHLTQTQEAFTQGLPQATSIAGTNGFAHQNIVTNHTSSFSSNAGNSASSSPSGTATGASNLQRTSSQQGQHAIAHANGAQSSNSSSGANLQSLPEMTTINLTICNTDFQMQIPSRFPKIEVKLFVGRLPRAMDEAQLMPLFTPFGEVLEIIIIRDKSSGMHKGSAFVKMASLTEADAAVRALHGIKVIDQQLGPVQVKYANGEPERLGLAMDAAQAGHNLGKLFVGSLPRTITEQELRSIFECFGHIEEVVLMKDNNTGQLKGCAFVKYPFKEQAIHAIRYLNSHVKLPTCPRPLEVKFAENRRAASSGVGSFPNTTGQTHPLAVPPHPSFLGKQAQSSAAGGAVSNFGPTSTDASRNSQNTHRTHQASGNTSANGSTQQPSNLNPRTVNGWTEYFTADGRPYYYHTLTKITQWTKPIEFNRVSSYVIQQPPSINASASLYTHNVTTGAAPGTATAGAANMHMGTGGTGPGSASDMCGPPGANVFVFHIPNEWGQNEVIQSFSQFGRIVSCYVATDRVTGRNKGYGFISYDEIQSAANAVISMNGCPVGSKRLKVSIKTGEEACAAPYIAVAQQQQAASQATANLMMPTSIGANQSQGTPQGNNYALMGLYHSSLATTAATPNHQSNPQNLTNSMGTYRAAPY